MRDKMTKLYYWYLIETIFFDKQITKYCRKRNKSTGETDETDITDQSR